MYYLRARYYDPVIARFITKDSYEGDIANPLSINQYSYCYNNPLIYSDPTGHYVDEPSLHALENEGYEISSWTFVPGQGDTVVVSNPVTGHSVTITDGSRDDYYDVTERVHDFTGYASTRPSSSDSPSCTYEDEVSSKATPTTGNKEIKDVSKKVQTVRNKKNVVVSEPHSYDMDKYGNDTDSLQQFNETLSLVSGVAAIAAVGIGIIATAMGGGVIVGGIAAGAGLISWVTGAASFGVSLGVCVRNPSAENIVSTAFSLAAVVAGAPGAKGALKVLRGIKKFKFSGLDVISRNYSMISSGNSLKL